MHFISPHMLGTQFAAELPCVSSTFNVSSISTPAFLCTMCRYDVAACLDFPKGVSYACISNSPMEDSYGIFYCICCSMNRNANVTVMFYQIMQHMVAYVVPLI